MYEFLLIDLDDTILDFKGTERVALADTLRKYGAEPTPEVVARYHVINRWHWEQLELGNLSRKQVLENRFAVLFGELGIPVDAAACGADYSESLSRSHIWLPGARQALEALQGKYRLFVASNGTASVQRSRMESAGLFEYFEDVFISQEMGADKPSPDFFSASFARIRGFDPSRAMIVGDSLTSDIQGGNNAGIATCWINPEGKPLNPEIRVDYQIRSLAELPALLESL